MDLEKTLHAFFAGKKNGKVHEWVECEGTDTTGFKSKLMRYLINPGTIRYFYNRMITVAIRAWRGYGC